MIIPTIIAKIAAKILGLSSSWIEPALSNRLSQSRVKAVAKMVIRFLNTKGASVGEAGRQLTSFPVAKTTDKAGEVISLKTDSFRFFVGSDYENYLKLI